MKVYYWSPHIDKVATVKAVINSAYSLKLYSKNKYIPFIINVAGEWDDSQGRRRKFYTLTTAGKDHLKTKKQEWLQFSSFITNVIHG